MVVAGEAGPQRIDRDGGVPVAIPAGVWTGWRLHGRLNQRQIYRACYGLLVITSLKLMWDGVHGYSLDGPHDPSGPLP